MKLQLDDKHYLNSDPQCCWITCMITPKDKKPHEKRVSGYTPTFEMAVTSYIDRKIKSSSAVEIQQLRNEVEELKETIRGWEVKTI